MDIEIDRNYFIEICKTAKNKQDAYNKLDMHRNTFEMSCIY